MSSPRLAGPINLPQKQEQRQTETEEQEQQQAIANLAYELWQQRGAPQGSSEQDWMEAERLLQAGSYQSSLGSR
jgi:hypothetical protein